MCDCCTPFLAFLKSPPKDDHNLERESFERIVAFLGQVSLFKKELPASELPKVAKHLETKTWPPGSILVKQGEMGEAFFLIQSGEVRVVTMDDDDVETERARLYVGDYFGGHTLKTERPNVATIIASGTRRLTTLSMSRSAFEKSGLKAKLVFPKRPAIYRNPRKIAANELAMGTKSETSLMAFGASKSLSEFSSMRTQEQQTFILECIDKNQNLRALLSRTDQGMIKAMVERAERQEIKKDSVVARSGHYGEAFYVIESGSFDVIINTEEENAHVRSAETAVASSTMAERLQRKQFFLQALNRRSPQNPVSKASRSVYTPKAEESSKSSNGSATPRGPRGDAGKAPTKSRHSLSQSVDGLQKEMRRTSQKNSEESVDDANVKVGDRVACVLPGIAEEAVGVVKEICSGGIVEVIFGTESRHVDADLLRPALEPNIITRLQPGDSFGELSLTYNVRMEATFKANEDCVVYVISRKAFKAGFKRHGRRMEEYVALLDEVDLLTPLLKAERWELARQASGVMEFKPYEHVLKEGMKDKDGPNLWYVILRGHGFLYANADTENKVKLERAGHFGERSLLHDADQPKSPSLSSTRSGSKQPSRSGSKQPPVPGSPSKSGPRMIEALTAVLESRHADVPVAQPMLEAADRAASKHSIATSKSEASIENSTKGFGLQRQVSPVLEFHRQLSSGVGFHRQMSALPDIKEVNVDAGPEGMTCLTFDWELIKQLIFSDLPEDEEEDEDPFVRQTTGECMSSSLKDVFTDAANKSVHAWIAEKSKRTDVNRRMDDVKLEDLRKVALLGAGGFADVFLAWSKKKDKHYALKRMSMGFIQSMGPGGWQLVVWERDLMFKVASPFLVQLYTTFKDSEYIYFLSEAVLGGDLMALIQNRSELFADDEPRGVNTSFYVACLIAALEHLHERYIVYRDMKPENVLIDESGYAKVCDFGFARYVLGKTNTMCGTPDYMAPEQIDFPHSHSLSVDWWAVGVLTFELITGQTPFNDEGIAHQSERLFAIRRSQESGQLRFPYSTPSGLKDFVRRLLTKLPQRLGAEGGAAAVRQDPWFEKQRFDFDALHRQALKPPFTPDRSKKRDMQTAVKDKTRESIFEPWEPDNFSADDISWTQEFG